MDFADDANQGWTYRLSRGRDSVVIAVISTLISSIALLGVAASLLLQARQLRASQLQAARSAQFDFVRVQFERPELAAAVFGDKFPLESALANWYMKYLELSYLLKAASRDSILVQATLLFSGKYFLEWWETAQKIYQSEATGKLEKEFLDIIDQAFQDAKQRKIPAAPSPASESSTPAS
jgi:Family of unknown function (DUF6082)